MARYGILLTVFYISHAVIMRLFFLLKIEKEHLPLVEISFSCPYIPGIVSPPKNLNGRYCVKTGQVHHLLEKFIRK